MCYTVKSANPKKRGNRNMDIKKKAAKKKY